MGRPTRRHRATLAFTCLLLDGAVIAAEPAALPAPRPVVPAGDELELFAELPVVISASRQQTSVILSPVPVSVVTADDIHDGAATSIAEAVQFVPGVDYVQSNRNIQAVGVRGLHGTFSDRMLTLIDGRNADNAAYGGSQFPRLPIMLADIDHIEVVRGPGGAVWGPNAFNGVLNIILKEPEDMLGLFASTTVTHFGDSYAHARWCESVGDWSWRISLGGRGVRSSAAALDDDTMRRDDWSNTAMSDNEVVWRATPTTKVRAGVGYAQGEGGSFEIIGYENDRDMTFRNLRAFARVEQGFGDGMGLHVQWYGNQDRYDLTTFADTRTREDALEGQVDLGAIGGHVFSLGLETRRIRTEMVDSGDPDQVTLVDDPYREYRAGAYLVDSWSVTRDLTLEGQLRGDRYTGTGNDWAGRLAALYALDDEKRQVLRLATAKSYRTPLPAIRDSQAAHLLLGSPRPFFLLPGGDLRNEELWSIEAGYTHQMNEGVMARLDGFYQRYEHLIGYVVTPPSPAITAQATNIDGATAYGGELELSWSGSAGRISAWYAYHHFATDENHQSLRAFRPSRHKVGTTGHLELGRGFAANLQYRYASLTTDEDAISIVRAPPMHRLDLNLAWRFDRARGEVMVGVEDLLNVHLDAPNGTGSFTQHDIPGQTFFVRGEYGF